MTMTNTNFAQTKVIPHARQLEQTVLGALILDKNAFRNAIGIDVDCFYNEDHRAIFNACLFLYNQQKPIDMMTVWERLKATGEIEMCGGPSYLAELTNYVASSANIEAHTRGLVEYATRRRLITECDKIMNSAFDLSSDPLKLVHDAEKQVFNIGSVFHKKKIYDAAQVGKLVFEHFQQTLDLEDGMTTGVPSGIDSLDQLMNGLQRGDLGIIAARPGMGKTALILNMVKHMSIEMNHAGAFFSLEMQAIQLGQRIVAVDSGIPNKVLRDGRKANAEQKKSVADAIGRFSNAPIWIDDTPGLTIHEIRSKARLLKAKHDIQFVMIDYLQLMSPSNYVMNTDAAIGEMSRGLKEMAKELDIPVIALSQLNRGVESRQNKIPNLGDLRSSGNIEQDADWISFLFRPEYYGIKVDEDDNEIPEGLTYIIVAKNRHGELANLRLVFVGETTKFKPESDPDFPNTEDEPPVSYTLPNGNEDDLPF